jgi:HAD superfamily hydrolase (TIGR01509 family)
VIQALIFDFDGLILDTETPEVQIWQELYAQEGQEFPLDEWVRTVVGSAAANMDPVRRLESLTGRKYDHQAIHEQAHKRRLEMQSTLPPLPGVADHLEAALNQGLRLAIASSSPHAWVDGYLQRLGFFDLFEAIICREQAAHIKPDPELFLKALQALGVEAEDALAFEDSPNGITAARAAGLRVVGVANPVTARLGPLDADLNLRSLADLGLADLLAKFGETLHIRAEEPGDRAAIREVEVRAFGREEEADLVDLARSRGKVTLSLAAVQEGRIAGHVLFTPVTLEPAGKDPGTAKGLGLGPIAVQPGLQRSGIGGRLVRAGLEQARRAGYDFVVLLGDPRYYSRFGFVPARDLGLTGDYGNGNEFQARELVRGSLGRQGGRVRYIAEFAETVG